MKYLLHSRKLRNALFKWIFCYVGTMILFTTVVTYSRYIATKAADDSARVARFDVEVSDICYNSEKANCSSGVFRAKELNEFYFNVDTSNLEVTSFFVTSIYLNGEFTIDDVNCVMFYSEVEKNWVTISKIEGVKKIDLVRENNSIKINIEENVIASEGEKRRYKVVAKYKNFKNSSNGAELNDAITVGFSAQQIQNY